MKVFIIFLLLGSTVATQFISPEELEELFYRAGKNEASENDINTLRDLFEIYRPGSKAYGQQNQASSRASINCIVCRSAFSAFFTLVNQGVSDDRLNEAVVNICISLSIVSPPTCTGIVPLNVPILTHIIRTIPEAAPRTFCGLIFQTIGDPNNCPYDDPRFEWTIDLPERVNVLPLIKKNNEKPLTVALITDAHIDPYYEPNGVADCNEPTCCRLGQTPRTKNDMNFARTFFEDGSMEENYDLDEIELSQRSSEPAGYWGDFRNCDTPIWAYDDVIERVAAMHKDIDVVYYMGDSIDHHVWETTYEMINDINLYIISKMRREFGDKILILPSIGNHESQPTNQFAPSSINGEKLNTTWLYDSLANKWDYFLTEEAKATVREHGGFSMLVRPGLRVISINSNIAYRYNWWLVYDPLDAKRHLEWLVQELYKAEIAGESVHILSHIPPGVHDFTYTWTREYNRIVNRFSSTIKAEFNGHTHSDQFKIFYSLEDGTPINMAWGAGSATAFTFYNLNYKIATFDSSTFEPLNIINYAYNLTEANLTPHKRPHWFQLYNMKSNYRINDLSAVTMDALVHRMVTDDLFSLDLYAAFYSKLSDARWPTCDSNCKINNLCKTVITVLWQQEKCEELRRLYSQVNTMQFS